MKRKIDKKKRQTKMDTNESGDREIGIHRYVYIDTYVRRDG